MIYFDNAATGGRKPDTVLSAVSSAIRVCANPGRSGHKLSLTAAKMVESCRKTLCSFFDGYAYDRVVFTKNCTEALNLAILGTLKKGDHVITTVYEHNSVLRPLEFLKKSGVIDYDICQGAPNELPDKISKLVRKNTRLVAVTTASNVTGETLPLDEIKRALPPHILLLCDGAQGAGHIPISMKKTGIDFLALAGHKALFGIQGSGALLFSERVCIKPLTYGGTGSMSISLDMPDFYPDALEAGTLSFPSIVSLLEGVTYLSFRQKQISEKMVIYTDYLISRLKKMPKIKVYSRKNPCGIVAFAHENIPSDCLADILSENHGIAVRGGLHCAPKMHEWLSTQESGLTRISFSEFNSLNEIDELITALQEIGV